jgi:hypothetical protein
MEKIITLAEAPDRDLSGQVSSPASLMPNTGRIRNFPDNKKVAISQQGLFIVPLD